MKHQLNAGPETTSVQAGWASRKLGKLTTIALVAARSKLAYWQEIGARAIFFSIVLLIFSQLWGSLLGSQGNLAGFDRRQLVWYLTITEVIALSTTSLLRSVENDVKSGQLAYLLIRPINYVAYQAANFFGEITVGIGMNLLAGGAVAWLLVGPPPTTLQAGAATLLLLVIGVSLQFLLIAMISLLSFFTEEARPFYWIYSKLVFTMGGLFVPIDIYPAFFQRLAKALPFQAVHYGPARAFIGGGTEVLGQMLTTALIWIPLLLLVIVWEFRLGVKQVNVNGG